MLEKLLFLPFALLCQAFGQAAMPSPAIPRHPLAIPHPLQDKNFYFLSLLQETPAVRFGLLHDPTLMKLTSEKSSAQTNLPVPLDQPASTYNQSFLWSDAQIQTVAEVFRARYRSDPSMRAWIAGPLRHSGTAKGFDSKSDEEMLIAAWIQAAQGINGIIQTYGMGKKPLYPEIDSISYDATTDYYREILHEIAWTVNTSDADHSLFFEPSLHYALYLLAVNRRDEAARFEPLESGENAAAIARIQNIDWSKYPYSVILVPGIGPEVLGVSLSPMGLLHVAAAVKRFREGAAPFILLSGGFVHPAQTQFSEALEMKKSLMHDYGISENAILIDPHARHTTTNFRNAARQIYRYNMPFDKPALVTGDIFQSVYIQNANFLKRCVHELGYNCFIELHRVSPIDLEWLPNIQSLQQNPADPLDP